MKQNLIILIVFLVLLLGSYYYYHNYIVPQPEELKTLRSQIEEKNKQLLAAQILAEKREGVTSLIRNNLIQGLGDSLAEKASVPFLRELTAEMDRLDIRLVGITPMDIVGSDDPQALFQKEYIQVPYEMQIIATYEEFGRFLDKLEKSPHLIRVASFNVTNDIDQSSYAEEIAGKPRQHPASLQLNTIAILKASFRSEPG
jgi:Tfp pilus assembly protein PilO